MKLLSILLFVYLSSWHIYRINLLAINDGIFNSLMLWLVFLIIKLIKNEIIISTSSLIKNFQFKEFFIIVIVVGISIHFRLNAALIIISAILATIFVKRYNYSYQFLLVFGILSISLFSVYSFIEVSKFSRYPLSHHVYSFIQALNLNQFHEHLTATLPRLTAGFSPINNKLSIFIFLIFPISTIIYFINGIRNRNFPIVFISLVNFSSIIFSFNFSNARVIWYIFPFIYLILLNNKFKIFKIFCHIFVLIISLQSIQQFVGGMWRSGESHLHLYLYENKIIIPSESIIITYRGRHAYFLLNNRSYRAKDFNLDGEIEFPDLLTKNKIIQKGQVYVLGDVEYINQTLFKLKNIFINDKITFETQSITPKLNKFNGWSFIIIKLQPIL